MRAETNRQKVEQLMEALGKAGLGPGSVYFTGGATAVLLGWRDTTVDVDMKLDPEPAGIFDALAGLKNRLDVNIELAAPDQFVPPLPGWRERSLYIERRGEIEFRHYDLYGQALSKIERYHGRDQTDISHMFSEGLVERGKLWDLFQQIERELIRYPAIDAAALRGRVKQMTADA